MIKYFKLMFLLFCVFCFNDLGFGAEKSVRLVTLPYFPPHNFDVENYIHDLEIIHPGSDSNRLFGLNWDILRESLHIMGYTIQLEILPWKRAVLMTQRNKVDILFPAGKNKEREKFFYYPSEPINWVNFVVFVRKDSNLKWKGLSSLNGLTIGARKGWNFGNEWQQNKLIKKFELNSVLQGFKMLEKHRLDGLVGYEDDYVLIQDKWKKQIKKLADFGGCDEFPIGSKNNPRVSTILKDFTEGKHRITQNGMLSKIKDKWK